MIRILHVDDCKEDLELTRGFLLQLTSRMRISWAFSAEEALDLLAGLRYDCVICDWRMPGLDGLDMLMRIRKLHRSLPIVVFSGEMDEQDVADALDAGADYYVRKEFNTGHYRNLLESVLEAIERRGGRGS